MCPFFVLQRIGVLWGMDLFTQSMKYGFYTGTIYYKEQKVQLLRKFLEQHEVVYVVIKTNRKKSSRVLSGTSVHGYFTEISISIPSLNKDFDLGFSCSEGATCSYVGAVSAIINGVYCEEFTSLCKTDVQNISQIGFGPKLHINSVNMFEVVPLKNSDKYVLQLVADIHSCRGAFSFMLKELCCIYSMLGIESSIYKEDDNSAYYCSTLCLCRKC